MDIPWILVSNRDGVDMHASGISTSGTLPNPPISGHHASDDFPISVYPDIEPDIGYDIADTRYRVFPDIGINIGIYRYRDQMSRYRVIEFQVSRLGYRTRCLLFPAGPGPRSGAGFPAAAACS